jgi:hypothetical protein
MNRTFACSTVTRDIEEAPSTYHVVLLVRECVASISPRELERIPEQCRPRRILDESDIARYSRRLTREYWQLRDGSRRGGAPRAVELLPVGVHPDRPPGRGPNVTRRELRACRTNARNRVREMRRIRVVLRLR